MEVFLISFGCSSWSSTVSLLLKVPSPLYRSVEARFSLFRIIFTAAAPIVYLGLERFPVVVDMYRFLVQSSAVLFCLAEAVAVVYVAHRFSNRIRQWGKFCLIWQF